MMRLARSGLAVTMTLAAPAVASPGEPPVGAAATAAAPVIGGADVPPGKWRDTVALRFPDQGTTTVDCTGVLIAPTVVLTAGHCIYDPGSGSTLPTRAWVGTNSLAHPERGEDLPVLAAKYHAGAYDLAVVLLAEPSTIAPRALATGWVQGDVVEGARVAITGFGAIDRTGEAYVPELQEAATAVADVGCTRSVGCDVAAQPDGELGAGGMGIDSCPGDSGGPLYLLTPYGEFLAGITSRGYADNLFQCSEGGIYTRPDKDELVAWIEQQSGVVLPVGRGPRAEPLTVAAGETARVTIDADDPRPTARHAWEILGTPAHGTASIDAAGVLTYTAADDALGPDVVRVRATDPDDPARSARGRVAIEVVNEGGCCQASGGNGRIWPGLVVLAALLGRRRRRLAP